MEKNNCLRCNFRHKDNENCTAVGGFCTAVPAAHCPLLRQYLDTGLTPEQCEMENIVILAEWHGNSWGGSNIMAILLGIALAFVFSRYVVFLLTDKESYTFLLVLSAVLAFLLWFPLNNCVQHRGETFQRIAAPPQITQQQLEEKYDTVDLITKTEKCPEGMVSWQVSFKQVD